MGKVKDFWHSPIICEGCNKGVKSVSRNLLTGNLKWLCKECAGEKKDV